MAELSWEDMPIHQAIKSDWKTPELLIEGSLNCAKTTVGLDKEIDALLKWPGIPILLARWTQDAVDSKLRKAFEDILTIRNIKADWDAKDKIYRFENGSSAHMFGLKAVSGTERFSKIRGLGVNRICVDQAEELDRAVAAELRQRLRPDLIATVSNRRFPYQLTLICNPSEDSFWLSRDFPTDDKIKGRKLYSLSIFDNKKLEQEVIDTSLRTFPLGHPKYETMVMGRRGLNVIGDPIYENLYQRSIHVRPLTIRADGYLIEAFYCGTHNPVWVVGQRTSYGGLLLLGGIIGRKLSLDDFLPLVKQYRREWFPLMSVKSSTTPMGGTYLTSGSRYTLLNILNEAKLKPVWKQNGNAPDVQLGMIEVLSGMLRRRMITKEESFGIETSQERWLEASVEDGIQQKPFLTFAFEGGYVWDEHMVSVSNKQVRTPKEDDWYFNAMRCVETLLLNFCVNQKTDAELDAQAQQEAIDGSSAAQGYQGNPYGWMSY